MMTRFEMEHRLGQINIKTLEEAKGLAKEGASSHFIRCHCKISLKLANAVNAWVKGNYKSGNL